MEWVSNSECIQWNILLTIKKVQKHLKLEALNKACLKIDSWYMFKNRFTQDLCLKIEWLDLCLKIDLLKIFV